MPNRSLLATANSSALMTALVLPMPFLSRTRSARIFTPDATPAYLPLDAAPLEPIRPATCVPWPYSSDGVTDAPFRPGVKSYIPTIRPVKSALFWMPESMTATVMLDPLNQSCRPSACLSVLTVPQSPPDSVVVEEDFLPLAVADTSASAETDRTSGSAARPAMSAALRTALIAGINLCSAT